jgi:hypothetical protein
MADDLDRELRDILRAEASQWYPASPLDETRRLLPEWIARRRRQQAVTGITAVLAALLMVALIAAAPRHARPPKGDLAWPLPRHLTSRPPTSLRPGGADGCQATCALPAPSRTASSGTATSAALGPTVTRPASEPSDPALGSGPTEPGITEPPTWPPPRGTVPPGSTVPTTVVSTTEPPTTTPPPPVTVYTFTVADLGRTVQVKAGDRIILDLVECPGTDWTKPVASSAAVLSRLSASVDLTSGTASAMFAATGGGQSELTARVRRAPCLTMPAFVLTIVVIG